MYFIHGNYKHTGLNVMQRSVPVVFIKTFCLGVSGSVQWCIDRTPATNVHLDLAFSMRVKMKYLGK